MRKVIAGMQTSLDGKIEGPEGYADWVDAWSDHYDVTDRVDACLLGAGMYPGYEAYWSAIQDAPQALLEATGKAPTPGEVEYAGFAARTRHYVLSSTMTTAQWPTTSFLRGLDEVAALKAQPGRDIYLVGGARTVAGLIDAGLVDELTLTIHPLVAGDGKALFATSQQRRGLALRGVEQHDGGLVSLTYEREPAS
jgi:dihydrofolate reductase